MGCECGGGKPKIFVPKSEKDLGKALYEATMSDDPEYIRAGNRLDVEREAVRFPLLKQELHSFGEVETVRAMLRAILQLPAFDPDCKNCHLGESECKK